MTKYKNKQTGVGGVDRGAGNKRRTKRCVEYNDKLSRFANVVDQRADRMCSVPECARRTASTQERQGNLFVLTSPISTRSSSSDRNLFSLGQKQIIQSESLLPRRRINGSSPTPVHYTERSFHVSDIHDALLAPTRSHR